MDGKKDRTKVVGGISLIAGLWLMLAAYMMGLGFMSNVFIVGVLVAVFSIIELSSIESVTWVSWVNGILGAWLLVSPLFLGGMVASELWNSVILGIIILGLAIWGSTSARMGMGHPKMG